MTSSVQPSPTRSMVRAIVHGQSAVLVLVMAPA
jgi:hypothetical protein